MQIFVTNPRREKERRIEDRRVKIGMCRLGGRIYKEERCERETGSDGLTVLDSLDRQLVGFV